MPTVPILPTIQDFIHKSPYASLELTFDSHLVLNSQNHRPFSPVQKQNSRIVINKKLKRGLAQMVVVDNLVFNFSFGFTPPMEQEFYLGPMLHLPSPLDQGHLHMDADQLTLSFRIYARDPELRIHVSQTYADIYNMEKFSTPLFV